MKHSILRRTAALALSLLLALSLTACGGKQDGKQDGKPADSTSQGSSGKLEKPKKNDAAKSDTTETPTAPVTAPEEPFAYSVEAQEAIDELFARREWEQYLAVASIGYREEGDTTDLTAWMHNESPALTAFWPFLTEIPAEDIIGDHGYLYCIVPLEERIQFTVKSVEWDYEGNGSVPTYSAPLYDCEVGRPFLIYFNYGGKLDFWDDDPDTVLEYEAEYTKIWHPYKEPDGTTTYDGDMILDFAHLYDVGDYIPRLDDGPDSDSEWLPPTDLGLANTTWYSDNGWVLMFGEDGSAEDGMVLYQAAEDGTLTPYDQGTWWMDDDSLRLGIYDGNCPFPLLISPSGEQLIVMQSDDGSVLPFFEKGHTTVGLTLSYG